MPQLDESSNPQPPAEPASYRWALPAASVCAVLGALFVSIQIYVSMIDHGHDGWRIFTWQLGGFLFWAVAMPHLLRSGARLLRPATRPRAWAARELATALALTSLHLLWTALIFYALQPYVPMAEDTFGQSLMRAWQSWLHLDLLVYGFGLVVGYGFEGYREARRAELRESRLETELARAQLETLRVQIQPHFLFNTLGSIAALVRRKRNARALEMVVGLSDLLRTTLERSEHPRVPLREELDLLRLYIDLQKVRFADRLRVEIETEEGTLEQPVPTLILQPLVENAIRHGIAPRAAPGTITVQARLDAECLHLSVADDGVGLPESFDATRDAGIGLSNVRSRLEQLGGVANFEIKPREGGGTIACVILPAEIEVASVAPRKAVA